MKQAIGVTTGIGAGIGAALTLAALAFTPAFAQETPGAQAQAVLQNSAGEAVGEATFTDSPEGVQVRVTLEGFTQAAGGERGIHLHERAACEPDFDTAGEHFNPEGLEHGLDNPQGAHAGDLPNIEVDDEGNATYEAVNDRITLDDTAGTSILAGDGTALVIHENRDDQVSDPTGESGDRIACGVVVAIEAETLEAEAGAGETSAAQAFTASK